MLEAPDPWVCGHWMALQLPAPPPEDQRKGGFVMLGSFQSGRKVL